MARTLVGLIRHHLLVLLGLLHHLALVLLHLLLLLLNHLRILLLHLVDHLILTSHLRLLPHLSLLLRLLVEHLLTHLHLTHLQLPHLGIHLVLILLHLLDVLLALVLVVVHRVVLTLPDHVRIVADLLEVALHAHSRSIGAIVCHHLRTNEALLTHDLLLLLELAGVAHSAHHLHRRRWSMLWRSHSWRWRCQPTSH